MLRAAGFEIAALALADDAVSLRELAAAPPERLALVFGAEGDGLSRTALAAADSVVTIPMLHGVDSLNVAAAAAVVLYALAVDYGERRMTDRSVSDARKSVYRRRRIVVFSALAVVLALLVSGAVYTANALGAPIPAAAPEVSAPEPIVAEPQAARAAGLRRLRRRRGRVRGTARRRQRRPAACRCASITKVITALVILDAHPIAPGKAALRSPTPRPTSTSTGT